MSTRKFQITDVLCIHGSHISVGQSCSRTPRESTDTLFELKDFGTVLQQKYNQHINQTLAYTWAKKLESPITTARNPIKYSRINTKECVRWLSGRQPQNLTKGHMRSEWVRGTTYSGTRRLHATKLLLH